MGVKEHLPYACNWVNEDGKPCSRLSQSTTGYCKWHLVTHRLEQFFDFRIELSGKSWLQFLVAAILYLLLILFFQSALLHGLWLYSGIYGAKSLNYNPSFTAVFFCVSLILLAIITLTFRGLRVRLGLPFYVFTCVLWGLAFFLLNFFGLVFSEEGARANWLNLSLYVIFIPVLFIVTGLERRTGYISAILSLAGLVFILLAGLSELLMYFFDYLPWLPADSAPNVHQASRAWMLYEGIAYLVVGVDAGLAMFFTGSLLTPFPSRRSFYSRPFSTRQGEGFVAGLIRMEWFVIGLLVVLYGQAAILRHMLLVLFRAYPFDYVPWPYQSMLYMAIVVGIHYALSRRWRRAEAIS